MKTTVQGWSIADLVAHVDGTSPHTWRHTLIPVLVRDGVLVKRGRRWFGTAAAIDAALVSQNSGVTEDVADQL